MSFFTSQDGGYAMLERAKGTALVELTRTRVLEYVRAPSSLFWVFGFPLVLVLALGLAFHDDAKVSYRAAWVGEAPGYAPAGSDSLEIMRMGPDEAARELARGGVDLVVRATLGASGIPQFVFRFDPQQPRSLAARLLAELALRRSLLPGDKLQVQHEHPQRREGTYVEFLVPGVLGLALLTNTMKTVAFAIVENRRNRLLKSYAATPMQRTHYLASFLVMRLLFLLGEVGVLCLASRLLFGIRIQGSLLSLVVVCVCGALCFTGIAFLLAARLEQPDSARSWIKMVEVPMWFLSGSLFAYTRYPEALQPIIKLLPLTALNDALRGVITQGMGFSAIAPQLAVIVLWGLVTSGTAVAVFKWQ